MKTLGIDLGTSTVKLALLSAEGDVQKVERLWSARHYGLILPTLREGLEETVVGEEPVRVCVTGANGVQLNGLPSLGDIPAIVEGVKYFAPEAGCIMEIGSQGSRFITDLQAGAPRFAVNEHCAGGTGSFFEDQMNRLGMRLQDYSQTVEQAGSVPRLSGRCAVFAKTDIIHRQAEGVSTPDILLGLCYAMIRNYKATIVRDLPVRKPVVFAGGVTENRGVATAIREVFSLEEDELLIPEQALYVGAVGAALAVENGRVEGTALTAEELTAFVDDCEQREGHLRTLAPLELDERFVLQDPPVRSELPEDGVVLGIDIGSTSTNLVLTGRDGTLVDFQYLRTSGDPERAVRTGLSNIQKRFGEVDFLAVGVTGSGRTRVGRMLGADTIRDEITAQAKAAAKVDPEVDTVFEIGGQDSKYISLQNGEVKDFQMNKICAAGTGSFVEEQAARMGIPIREFGPLALSAGAPAELGERCTVFIETAISSAESMGAGKADIAAGLCHSIVRNYLHKVVGNKPVGTHIVLQGGVAYNPGIVAAFRHAYPDTLKVSPCFSISGAYGVSLLALEHPNLGHSTFKGFDFTKQQIATETRSAEVQRNIAFYEKAQNYLTAGYTGEIDPSKKTVGLPYALLMHRMFPMVHTYFKELGYNVLLSQPTDEEIVALSQQYAVGETCYPVKLIYGHMAKLAEMGVDYIFLPTVRTMRHASTFVAHPYGCVYMQTAAISIAKNLKLEEKGIRVLSPVFDLDMGLPMMGKTMIGMGTMMGHLPPVVMKCMLKGANAMRRYLSNIHKWGQELLDDIGPDDKVLVLTTRPYGIADPVLNMHIPELLLERGYKVITNSQLPGDHDIDLSGDYPNMYWPFGEHILSCAKLIKNHPNLYMVYLVNHGCGPDTMLQHLVADEMGDKPYLQIEVDEHFSPVGVITRIEAFLNSLEHRPAARLPEGFEIRDVAHKKANILPSLGDLPASLQTVPTVTPHLGRYTDLLAEYTREAYGLEAQPMPAPDGEVLAAGRAVTTSKEYLTFTAAAGMALTAPPEGALLLPFTEGSEADGTYAEVIRGILDARGREAQPLVSPLLETLPATARDFDRLFRAVLAGDLLYAAPAAERDALAERFLQTDGACRIPSGDALKDMADAIGQRPVTGRRLAAVGTPMCLTDLDSGILETLEAGGDTVFRQPLSEYLWFLWTDCGGNDPSALEPLARQMADLHRRLGARSPFSAHPEKLATFADRYVRVLCGGNGRYRYAKAAEASKTADAVLALTPRYENTATILDMRSLSDRCGAPLFRIQLDDDWDESAWARLRSFLFYV